MAFRTALALSVFYRARLEILHVSGAGQELVWEEFPSVRETLEAWRLLPRGSRREDVDIRLGVGITKVDIRGDDPASGISNFILKNSPDLLVASSHGRTGISQWILGSVAIETLRMTSLSTLLLGPSAKTFIDEGSGRIRLQSVVFPVALSPPPGEAVEQFRSMMAGILARIHYVHVRENDDSSTQLAGLLPNLTELQGDVVPAILSAAQQMSADMIVMPTARHKGFLDAVRGSVTQRVLHDAPCPVLALPS